MLVKSKTHYLLRAISVLLIHALILSNVAFALPTPSTENLAPPSRFDALVQTVNGIRTEFTIDLTLSSRDRKQQFEEDIARDGISQCLHNEPANKDTVDDYIYDARLESRYLGRLYNAYDAIIDRMKESEIPFTGKITAELYFDGNEIVLNVIDNGKTVDFESNGMPAIRERDRALHFGYGHVSNIVGVHFVQKRNGIVRWHPLIEGTWVETRLPRQALPTEIQIPANETISIDNNERNVSIDWPRETARAIWAGETDGKPFMNRTAFYYISQLIGRDLNNPPSAQLREPIPPETRAQALIDEIREHVDPAELEISKTRGDLDPILRGFELDRLRYRDGAYELPIYREGIERFFYRFHVDRNEDWDWEFPDKEGNIYIKLESSALRAVGTIVENKQISKKLFNESLEEENCLLDLPSMNILSNQVLKDKYVVCNLLKISEGAEINLKLKAYYMLWKKGRTAEDVIAYLRKEIDSCIEREKILMDMPTIGIEVEVRVYTRDFPVKSAKVLAQLLDIDVDDHAAVEFCPQPARDWRDVIGTIDTMLDIGMIPPKETEEFDLHINVSRPIRHRAEIAENTRVYNQFKHHADIINFLEGFLTVSDIRLNTYYNRRKDWFRFCHPKGPFDWKPVRGGTEIEDEEKMGLKEYRLGYVPGDRKPLEELHTRELSHHKAIRLVYYLHTALLAYLKENKANGQERALSSIYEDFQRKCISFMLESDLSSFAQPPGEEERTIFSPELCDIRQQQPELREYLDTLVEDTVLQIEGLLGIKPLATTPETAQAAASAGQAVGVPVRGETTTETMDDSAIKERFLNEYETEITDESDIVQLGSIHDLYAKRNDPESTVYELQTVPTDAEVKQFFNRTSNECEFGFIVLEGKDGYTAFALKGDPDGFLQAVKLIATVLAHREGRISFFLHSHIDDIRTGRTNYLPGGNDFELYELFLEKGYSALVPKWYTYNSGHGAYFDYLSITRGWPGVDVDRKVKFNFVYTDGSTESIEMKDCIARPLFWFGFNPYEGVQQPFSELEAINQFLKTRWLENIGNIRELSIETADTKKAVWRKNLSLFDSVIPLVAMEIPEAESREVADKLTPETEQLHAIKFVRQTEEKPKPSFIALGTSWIKGYEKDRFLQYDALNPLIASLRQFCDDPDHNIEFIDGDDEHIARRIGEIKQATPDAQGIVLAGQDMIANLGLQDDANVLLAGVNNKHLTIDSYIRLMEMLNVTLELFHMKIKGEDIDEQAIIDKHKSLGIRFHKGIITFEPDAEPMDYEILKEIYKLQRFA